MPSTFFLIASSIYLLPILTNPQNLNFFKKTHLTRAYIILRLQGFAIMNFCLFGSNRKMKIKKIQQGSAISPVRYSFVLVQTTKL